MPNEQATGYDCEDHSTPFRPCNPSAGSNRKKVLLSQDMGAIKRYSFGRHRPRRESYPVRLPSSSPWIREHGRIGFFVEKKRRPGKDLQERIS